MRTEQCHERWNFALLTYTQAVVMSAANLEEVFESYCGFGVKGFETRMDGDWFSKFCRDKKILDKKLTATDTDIIFAKVKSCVRSLSSKSTKLVPQAFSLLIHHITS